MLMFLKKKEAAQSPSGWHIVTTKLMLATNIVFSVLLEREGQKIISYSMRLGTKII